MEITDLQVKEAMQVVFGRNPKIRQDDNLIISVYKILTRFYVEDTKDFIILQAPTGIGKSVIGYMLHFCCNYIENIINGTEQFTESDFIRFENFNSFYLTSAKALQEQINGDINNFGFENYLHILKGTDNYCCDLLSTKEIIVPYKERKCIGLTAKERGEICQSYCSYMSERAATSEASCAVFNYSYFLNVFRSGFSPFFQKRSLTICDEAHLLPDIVANSFNIDLVSYVLNAINRFKSDLKAQFGNMMTFQLLEQINKEPRILNRKDYSSYDEFINACEREKVPVFVKSGPVLTMDDFEKLVFEALQFYGEPMKSFSSALKHFDILQTLLKYLRAINQWDNKDFVNVFKKTGLKCYDSLESHLKQHSTLLNLSERPDDIYFTSEKNSENFLGESVYKHTIKDLSEAEMVKEHFLSNVKKCLFMSATIGDVDEFAQMIGLEPDSYVGFNLKSPFNFDKSPIYKCNVGKLNYENFASNINNVVEKSIHICLHIHPNDAGVIHTATFKVLEYLYEKVRFLPENWRFLFYKNSEEKEQFIKLMKESKKPYILVGPSLYEGIDLKDDMGRFNILMKVPFAQINDYIALKKKRYPFWYNRNTKEKIIQAIGRTNRSVDDWSITYLMDSCFETFVSHIEEPHIKSRLKSKCL